MMDERQPSTVEKDGKNEATSSEGLDDSRSTTISETIQNGHNLLPSIVKTTTNLSREDVLVQCPDDCDQQQEETEADQATSKGPLRRLCDDSNGNLKEALLSLDRLHKSIDSFRHSPLWQQNPEIRRESIVITSRPASLVVDSVSTSSSSSSQKKQAVSSSRGSERDSGIADDTPSSTTTTVVGHSSSVDSTTTDTCTLEAALEEPAESQQKEKKKATTLITFETGVQMIHDLLVDTQKQCVSMVNENQRTANRFDNELGRCHTQMDVLRKELAYAHRCVNDLEVNMMINGSATESDTELHSAEHQMEAEIYRLREDNGRLRTQYRALQREYLLQRQIASANSNQQQSQSGCSDSPQSQRRSASTSTVDKSESIAARMVVSRGRQLGSDHSTPSPCQSNNSLNGQIENNNNNNNGHINGSPESSSSLHSELVQAREACIALKHDRKRLKAEKVELLNQMKEVYQTLEAKELELRDFIRQFEQKMRESDKGIKELIWEKEKMEKEKKQLSDALEKANENCQQSKNEMEKEKLDKLKLQAQLKELQGRFVLLTGQQPQMPPVDRVVPPQQASHNATPGSLGYASLPVSPNTIAQVGSTTDSIPIIDQSPRGTPRSIVKYTAASEIVFTPEEAAVLRRRQKPMSEIIFDGKRGSRFVADCECPGAAAVPREPTYYEDTGGASGPSSQSTQQHLALLRRGRASGRKSQHEPMVAKSVTPERSSSINTGGNRLSRLFNFTGHAMGRSKSKDEQQNHKKEQLDLHDRSSSTLAVDAIAADLNLVEKADHLSQARQIPMARWRQSHVLAWLELELSMYAYTEKFATNVKSGKVLLSLSDHEIEHVLGVTSALHKKKFRLAIEEYRAPALCKFPAIKEVTNQYVCRQWLPSIGMPQYTQAFRQHLIDGRLLNYLNKKQLDKYLGVSRRFHQLSILKGIELLRLFNFDNKVLSKRRLECDRENMDLLVWTNARLGRWFEQVDLGEYADNLRESGLHGGLCVLDPAFTVDTLATALGIPSGRQMIRKHLAAEFLPLLNQARTQLDQHQSSKSQLVHRSGGSLGRAFSRSYTIGGDEEFSTPPADPKVQRLSSKRRRGLRGSIGRVFGLRVRRSTTASNEEQFQIDDFSPARSATLANLGGGGSSHDLRPIGPHQTVISASIMNTSSPKPLNRSTGTLSSTTSDLGSSIERSQHMKTILGGTPKVLTQPPMTSMSAPSSKSAGVLKSSISDAADLSRLQHLCLSPGEVLLNGGGNGSSRNPLIRLRNKARHGMGDVPKMGMSGVVVSGLVDPNSTRSPGATPARPHSVGDFGGLASAFYCSPNGGNNYQSFVNGQRPVWFKPNSSMQQDESVSFSPQRLQTSLSAEHFAVPSSNGQQHLSRAPIDIAQVVQPQKQHNVNEDPNAEQQSSATTNGHQVQYSMGTIAEQGEPQDSETDTIPRTQNQRQQQQHRDRLRSPPDAVDHSPRYHSKNGRHQQQPCEASPSRSSTSSLSPSRRDRPRSLQLKTASSTNTDLYHPPRQALHRDSINSTTSSMSKCEECTKERRQRSVPPLASTDSIHETDL